jgi:DNA polymerase III delta prime subunit
VEEETSARAAGIEEEEEIFPCAAVGGMRAAGAWTSSMVIGGEETDNGLAVVPDTDYARDPEWERMHAALPPQRRLQWDVALAPSTLWELSGQTLAKDTLSRWWGAMRGAAKPDVPPCALLHGPPGSGKTLMVHLAAATYGYRVVCPDLERGKSAAEEVVGLLSKTSLQTCEDARPVALLLEHVDDQDDKVRQAAHEIQKRWSLAFSEAAAPRSVLILTCENAWDKRMKPFCGAFKSPKAKCVAFPSLAPPDMKAALHAACKRGGIAVTEVEQSALLNACSGRMRSALLSLQFLRAGGEDAPMAPETLRLDTLMSARSTAQAALSTGADPLHAANDVEGVVMALHAALPEAAKFGEEQITLRLKELRSGSVREVSSLLATAVGEDGTLSLRERLGAGSAWSRAAALHSLEAESLSALARSLDAMSQHDVEEGSAARKCKTFPQLGAYLAADGFGAPVRQMRARRAQGKVPVDMGCAWVSCPEYFVRQSQASKQYKDGRNEHEARTLLGCEIAAVSEAKDGCRMVELPPHIQSLGQVRPSRNELQDFSILFQRKWVCTSDAKHSF